MNPENISNRILSLLIGFTLMPVLPSLCAGIETARIEMAADKAEIVFPDDRQFFCHNESPFTITGINNANETGSFTIEGGVGLTDNLDNTATVYPELLGAGTYGITYTYVNRKVHRETEYITIGNSPDAGFTWDSECFRAGQPAFFRNNSSSNGETITGYKWLFYNESGYDSLMTRNGTYTFPQPGTYLIELRIETSIGCPDTMTREFALRPTLEMAGQTYFEDFEDGAITWQSATIQQNTFNSWLLEGPVKGFDGASSGEYCWFTYMPTSAAPFEQSWVTSPCFDFTGTKKPMMKFELWRLFDGTRDGAVLQATSDSGQTWQNVGVLHDGINWFNADNILGSPGGQSAGWSNIRDAGWMEVRHSLEEYQNKPLVQFRIAYGSDGTARNTDGLAFDNVWIGERNKVALIEHFTNMSDPSASQADAVLNETAGNHAGTLIDLQYHTSYPGADPLNAHNPQIPDARLLYYGLTDVPYSILDGGSTEEHRFDHDLRILDEGTIEIQSLNDGRFAIRTRSQVVGNSLHAEADVMALQDIPSRELTLHLAVTENRIIGVEGTDGETVCYSVVKTMLPDAGGTTFYQAWSKGETQQVHQSWNMQHVYDLEELRLVAFIQDEQTGEVLQASMDTVQIHTGINDPQEDSQAIPAFIAFLDPVSSRATVRFRDILKQQVKLELYNNLGSLMYALALPSGSIQGVFSVTDFADGLYLIKVTDGSKVIGTGKLAVFK